MSCLVTTLIVLCCGACDGDEPSEVSRSGESETPPPPPTREEIVRDADQRRLTDLLRRGLLLQDPALRRLAARGIAQLRARDEPATSLLRRSLRDTDPGVRTHAFEGLAALGADAPVAALAGALAAEEHPDARSRMLRAMGRVPSARAFAAVVPGLRSEVPSVREHACLAVGERALAGEDVSPRVRSRLGAMLAPPEPAEVRLACAYALARLPAQTAEAAPGVAVGLGLATGDGEESVRVYAYRALGRIPDTPLESITPGVEDDAWQVRVAAFRSLARLAPGREGGPAAYARALRAAHERMNEEGITAGPLHVFLAAVAGAAPISRATPIHDLAAELHRSLGRASDEERTRDRGLAHCAAAQLVDRGRGWPSRVESCGLEQVGNDERAVLEAEVLGGLDGAHDQRLARLRHLFSDGAPVVREAVVAAAAAIVHPEAIDLVLEGIEVDDAGVRAASLDALVKIAGWRPSADTVPPPLPSDRVVSILRQAREGTPDDELETLVTWIAAVRATEARALAEPLGALASHPNLAVRREARASMEAWELEVPSGELPPVGETPSPLPEPEARPIVLLHTGRGDVRLELRPDEAPTTVARFLSLVEDGFYDGLTFHRVVPGFVAQGGDPRGDGYGGPPWSQRCETSALPYERGTLGMALAGRDTGGSQFFITHGRQPHLEGRYTVFGQVVDGMEHVDALQAGDPIESAELVSQ